jgi:hypothetical protein
MNCQEIGSMTAIQSSALLRPRQDPFPGRPHLDHVFLTSDAETIRAVNECDLFKADQFGRFWIKHAESTLLGKYTATNIFGRASMLEFFQGRFGSFEHVNTGLVLSFDYPGETDFARERLTDAGIAFHGELIKYKFPGGTDAVPWYHQTRLNLGEDCPLTLFLSEITTEFFEKIGARFGSDGQQSRWEYFEARLKRPHNPNQYMRDLTGISVRLRSDHARTVARALSALGYEASGNGRVIELEGPESIITLTIDDEAQPGLTEARIQLHRPYQDPGRPITFSPTSSLRLSPGGPHDTTALWSFVPRRPGRD